MYGRVKNQTAFDLLFLTMSLVDEELEDIRDDRSSLPGYSRTS